MFSKRKPGVSPHGSAPILDEHREYWDSLGRSYYIRNSETHEPLPFISNYHLDGVVIPLYTVADRAQQVARAMAETYEVDAEVVQIQGQWDFLLGCAMYGFAGTLLDDGNAIHYYNRLSDLDRSSPSLMYMRLTHKGAQSKGFYFNIMGPTEIVPDTVIGWVDYNRFDKASNAHHLRGAPLPEDIDAHAIADAPGGLCTFPDGATFLGPYVSVNYAVPVFSGRIWAVYFARLHGLIPPNSDEETVRELNQRRFLDRVDLLEFLDEMESQYGRFVDIGLNPGCHRFRQGWFFKEGNTWFLETIAGVWQLQYEGLIPREDVRPFKPHLGLQEDPSNLLSRVSSVVQHPLKRLCGANRSLLSNNDANELLDREFLSAFDPTLPPSDGLLPTDSFIVDAFDKITGDRFARTLANASGDAPPLPVLVFPDFVAAASFLINRVLPHDERVRFDGYRLCHGGGSDGSRDREKESSKTAGVVAAIRSIVTDALTTGYRPHHALCLKRLMQDATVTFEATDVGYVGDLLFFGLSDGNELWSLIETEDDGQTGRLAKLISRYKAAKENVAKNFVIPNAQASQLRGAVAGAFDLAESESLLIAATAMDEFARVGRRAGYDYAGVSMKASKLVERELLRRVFVVWRDAVRERFGKNERKDLRKRIEEERTDNTSRVLLDWVDKRRKLELGTMRHCLRGISGIVCPNELILHLDEFLATLSDGRWLTSEDFDNALSDISTKYRNGGVHEKMVDFDTADEALQRILLGPSPLLKKLLEATVRVEAI